VWDEYDDVMLKSWDALEKENPAYARRLRTSVTGASGAVLEIGAGCGNMTRWLDAAHQVTRITAVEAYEAAVAALGRLNLPKVAVLQQAVSQLRLPSTERFDTVVACELIEHLYPDEELAMLKAIRPRLAPSARYVVSTPIGWMPDPFHVRGFTPEAFRSHLEKYYGPVTAIDLSSGYSQVATGLFSPA
jgi:2-polyprenyl-3-methyl-5-hydroxy-6-metoxy-1,4-benzoquinol methylase